MKKSTFKFKVGDRVKCTHEDSDAQGPVIARGRYSRGVAKFCYGPGDRYYVLESGGSLEVVIEQYLVAL